MSRLILETERLQLFELSPDNDADVDLQLRLLNSPGFLRFIGDRGVRTADDARDSIRERNLPAYVQHGYGMWRVALKSGTDIGNCGLVRREGLDAPDLGYAFLPEHGGHGYAREAALGCIEYARCELRIPRLLAIVNPDNLASIRMLQDLRFGFERMLALPGIDHEVKLFSLELH